MALAAGLASGHPNGTKTFSMRSALREPPFPRAARILWQFCLLAHWTRGGHTVLQILAVLQT